ncbi:hypothetical protein P7K49_031019 [Saguinus oedipus]|uniref:Uncharacterized protein n=1 Tax=Saguinus oedipus TaxID=9490 RepID=A0ABQ9U4P3_SAGOE|nr:hypothetical protein P7K49_031019 [Saguinus oedipus]
MAATAATAATKGNGGGGGRAGTGDASGTRKKKGPGPLATAYLVIYNVVMTAGRGAKRGRGGSSAAGGAERIGAEWIRAAHRTQCSTGGRFLGPSTWARRAAER